MRPARESWDAAQEERLTQSGEIEKKDSKNTPERRDNGQKTRLFITNRITSTPSERRSDGTRKTAVFIC